MAVYDALLSTRQLKRLLSDWSPVNLQQQPQREKLTQAAERVREFPS
jgi:hypothetical protein